MIHNTDPSSIHKETSKGYTPTPMSLYRKYRPKVFTDVYGQEHVVSTLEKASGADKLAHAYLFAGSRGTGKTSVARILAKILMTKGVEDPTLKKQIEQAVDDGNIVDLLEIDAASNRGIDDVRDLIEKIQFSPVVASTKVYIIDEVHMLTKEAFNALLKTLEEPPAYAYFILATTELNKIPTTIQSRCQCFPFRHIREEDIVRRLQYIGDQEHINVERDALRAIAHASEGGMRDAISLLDQMRSLDKITLEDVAQRIGTTGQEYIEEVLVALSSNDRESLLKGVSKVEDAGIPLDVYTRQLLKLLRKLIHGAIEQKQSTQRLLSMQESLLQAVKDMRTSPVPGLVLECALLSLCAEGDVSAEKEKVVEEVAEAKPEVAPEKVVTKEPEEVKENLSEAVVEAIDVSLDTIQDAWPNILSETNPASVKMSLKNGRVSGVKDNTVILHFASAFHRDKVQQVEASRAIESVLEKMFKAELRIQCELEDSASTGVSEVPKEQEVVNLADAAAEIF